MVAHNLNENLTKMTKKEAYQDIADLYLSIIAPEQTLGLDIEDTIASEWIANNLPNHTKILDAGCGLGFDLIALHRGLINKKINKTFDVYGADYSANMLKHAINNGKKYKIDVEKYKESTFADLKYIKEWQNKFDCVMVNYAIYTYPDFIKDYDKYFLDCLEGISSVLKKDGYFIFNIRSWNHCEEKSYYENIHQDITYQCEYHWSFNNNGYHKANVIMKNCQSNLTYQTSLNFAKRSISELEQLLEKKSYKILYQEENDEFITLITQINR